MFDESDGYVHVSVTQEDIETAKIEDRPSCLPTLRQHFKTDEISFNIAKETILIKDKLYIAWGDLDNDRPHDLILREASKVFHQNIPSEYFPEVTK